eukprot:768399-Hanusia_phi.AAC.7
MSDNMPGDHDLDDLFKESELALQFSRDVFGESARAGVPLSSAALSSAPLLSLPLPFPLPTSCPPLPKSHFSLTLLTGLFASQVGEEEEEEEEEKWTGRWLRRRRFRETSRTAQSASATLVVLPRRKSSPLAPTSFTPTVWSRSSDSRRPWRRWTTCVPAAGPSTRRDSTDIKRKFT